MPLVVSINLQLPKSLTNLSGLVSSVFVVELLMLFIFEGRRPSSPFPVLTFFFCPILRSEDNAQTKG